MTGRALKTVDLHTAGRPAEAIAAAAARRVEPGGQYRATVAHDTDCPCLVGRALSACTCEIVRVTWRRVA